MIGIALDNRIVRTFISQEVKRAKSACLIEIDYAQLSQFELLIFKGMYYSKVFVLMAVSEQDKIIAQDMRQLISTCKSNSISIIFIAKYPRIFQRIKRALDSCECDVKELSVSTINNAIVRQIMCNMYKASTGKQIPEPLQKKLLKRLRRSINVDSLLDEMISHRTLTSLKEMVDFQRKVYNGNFASSIILGKHSTDTAKYIQENISSIPYLIAILEHFVEDLLYLHSFYMDGSFRIATISEFKTGGTKGKFNKYGMDPRAYLEVLENKSYEYLYILNTRIKDADTRTKRILLLGELLL